MAGYSQDKNDMNQHYLSIESWMLENVKAHGYERYDDLHVDQIDPAWRPRDSWIQAGSEAFRIASDLRDRLGLDLVVVLAFSLKGSDKPQGVDFRSPEDLKGKLNWSPPSLYLFQRGKEPRTELDSVEGRTVAETYITTDIDPAVLGVPVKSKRCYYMEFKQTRFNEYSRTLFVEA